MIKLAATFLVFFPLSVFAVTDAQSFFMATAKVYNARLNKSAWLTKMKATVPAEEIKSLEDSLNAIKDDQLPSAVQRDRSTLAFVNMEGKTLATLKVNEEGKITVNDQELNLEAHTGFKAQLDYLKTLVANDLADAGILKFHQNLLEGTNAKTLARIETESSDDAQTLKSITAGLEVKRLDIQCSLQEDQLPSYLVKKYKSGKDSEIAQKDKIYSVRSLSLHQLDEYDEPYEERVDVVIISPEHEVKFTKPSKKKKGAKLVAAEPRFMEVWNSGNLVKKNVMIEKASNDAEIQRAKALLKCCQDTAKSCLDRLRP